MKMTGILLVFTSLLLSCGKKCDLAGQKNGTGEIVENALIVYNVPTEISKEMKSNEYVINSDLENTFNMKVSFDKGASSQEIDFDQYTLLGKYAEGEKCEIVYEREIERDNAAKKIMYQITVYQCGSCKKMALGSMNWVLVPKIPSDFEVVFNVKEK